MTWHEGHHVPPRVDCPYPNLWTAPDRIATEDEVADAWAALVRALKPACVVELGTYRGYTTAKIGRVLKEQGFGILYAVEMYTLPAEQTRHAVEGLPVEVHQIRSLEFVPPRPVDVLICDTEPEIRPEEVVYYRQFASPRCVIIVHDTAFPESKFVQMRQRLEALDRVQWVFLPTPRGFGIGRYVD